MGSISMPQGKGSQMHNRREYEKFGKPIPANIDSTKTAENITLIDKDIREAYQEIFGEALAEYNKKQQRADRKIDDYLQHIRKSKNGEKPFYEDVLQWGKKEDFESEETRQRAKEALVRYTESFEERNPQLRLIGAYIHMDEASPHLHLDYVPVAEGYSRGLSCRNSLDRAMKQMGFYPEKESKQNNATKIWKENERAVFKQICVDLGLDVDAERKARGSLSVDEYKAAKEQMMGDIEREREAAAAELKSLRDLKALKTDITEINTGKSLPFGYVAVKKKELDELKEQAKAYAANRDEILSLRERSEAVTEKEQQLQIKESDLQRLEHRQHHLNELLESSEAEVDALKTEKEAQNDKYKDLQADYREDTERLLEAKIEPYKAMRDIVNAVAMLSRSDGPYWIAYLTDDQERLIGGVMQYAADLSDKAGYPDISREIGRYSGLSDDLAQIIRPTQRRRSRDDDFEL